MFATPHAAHRLLKRGHLAQQLTCQFCSVGAYSSRLWQALERVDPVAYRMVGEPGSELSGRGLPKLPRWDLC
jgi:hypothetical protein